MNQLKMFTVQEANQLIPQLNAFIQQLQIQKKEILAHEVEIDALELVTEAKDGRFHPEVEKRLEAYEASVNAFYAIIDQVHQMGCFLKDVDMGLVDFYTIHQGRVVYLCWRQGEQEIQAWHEIGKGFAHRQPLEAEDS